MTDKRVWFGAGAVTAFEQKAKDLHPRVDSSRAASTSLAEDEAQ